MSALKLAVDSFEAAALSGESEALLAAKTNFYEVLIGGCQNVFVRQMLNQLHNRVNLLRFTSMRLPGRLPHSAAEILEIYNAVSSRDGGRASAACRYHVEMAAKVALKHLRERI